MPILAPLAGVSSTGNAPSGPTPLWNDDFTQWSGAYLNTIIRMCWSAYRERCRAAAVAGGLVANLPPIGDPGPVNAGDDMSVALGAMMSNLSAVATHFVPDTIDYSLFPGLDLQHSPDPLVRNGFPFFGSAAPAAGAGVEGPRGFFWEPDNGQPFTPATWDRQYPKEIQSLGDPGVNGQVARYINNDPFAVFNGTPPSATKYLRTSSAWALTDFKATPTRLFDTLIGHAAINPGFSSGGPAPSPGDYITLLLCNQVRDVMNTLVWTYTFSWGALTNGADYSCEGQGFVAVDYTVNNGSGTTLGNAIDDYNSGAHAVFHAGANPGNVVLFFEEYFGGASPFYSSATGSFELVALFGNGQTCQVDFYDIPYWLDEQTQQHYDHLTQGIDPPNQWFPMATPQTFTPVHAGDSVKCPTPVGSSTLFGGTQFSDFGGWKMGLGAILRWDVAGGFAFTKNT